MRLVNTSAVVLAFAVSACDGGGGSRTFGTGTGGPGPSTTNQISVRDDNFSPSSTTVPAGTTVTWTWAGVNIHNVTFTNGPSSANQTTGGTFQRTFSAAGTFPYTCTNHAGMNGAVIVQ
jgi:plastocyanin